ncbi:hypothetical protein TNIN_235481 [Trichonephila inaurata madagascariensis]|uniref:Uncharacterized protein n=1 Tax=Trichonephila inaurata madagascariensis TaxID=2747483 RepID=A0A8X7BUJ7_9ARAC|nr:hypothetical protein TNIN_235481 [Trichonephila inaurata madagascariensis]
MTTRLPPACYQSSLVWKLFHLSSETKPVLSLLYITLFYFPDGNIYVFGGFRTQTMEQMINTVYFDKKNNAWKPLCELPKRAAGFVVAVSGN